MSDIIIGRPFLRCGPSSTIPLFNMTDWVNNGQAPHLNGFTVYFEPLLKDMPSDGLATPFSIRIDRGDSFVERAGFIVDDVARRIVDTRSAPIAIKGLPGQEKALHLTTCTDLSHSHLFTVTIQLVFKEPPKDI